MDGSSHHFIDIDGGARPARKPHLNRHRASGIGRQVSAREESARRALGFSTDLFSLLADARSLMPDAR